MGADSDPRSAGVVLRRLGAPDVALMRRMNVMFGRAFAEPETYEAAPPSAAYLERVLGQEHVIALAAFIGDDVAGGLIAYEFEKFEQERREVYIYDLAVAEPFRRRGIATALINRLREIAAQRGARVVYVQADYGDEPAIALYEGLGRREDVLHFDIDV